MTPNWSTSRSGFSVLSILSLGLFFWMSGAFTSVLHQQRTPAYGPVSPASPKPPPGHWVATWTAAQQGRDQRWSLPDGFFQDGVVWTNTTIRQTHLMSIGADQIRVRFSNTFGTTPLRIDKVTIALPVTETNAGITTASGSTSIRHDTLQTLAFDGRPFIIIPPNGQALSDPLTFHIRTKEVVTLTMYFQEGQASQAVTCHRAARTSSWLTKGDHTSAHSVKWADSAISYYWYVVTAIEAWKSTGYQTVVVLGDSITEGVAAPINTDEKWPNFLFERLQESTDTNLKTLSVVNQAITGNQLLLTGQGPNLSSRLDRDALAVMAVKYAIILEGANDIRQGDGTLQEQNNHTENAIVQYKQVITRLHDAGIPVFGGTVSPFSCTSGRPNPNNNSKRPDKEQQRVKFNEWIRTSGIFDGIIDFDEALRDPNNHSELALPFDGGDCSHPATSGLREMAATIPLDLFIKFKAGVNPYL